MEFGKVLKESCWFAVGTALSCGPSQVVGVVKGSIDLALLAFTQAKIARLEHTLASKEGIDLFKIKSALETNRSLRAERIKSLQGDGLLLIPLLGANLAWRIYKKKPTYDASPIVEFSANQLLEHSGAMITKLFYPLSINFVSTRTRILPDSSARIVQIDVLDGSQESGRRFLDARYYRHDPTSTKPTVVIFHPNGATCDGMYAHTDYYFKKGYDVLAPTMGGYPGSSPCATSEITSLQDVEAVRLYLQNQGVTRVGYYGMSIGGSLAFQAATAPTAAKELTTTFVIADQTFTKAADVAANCVPPSLRSIARGAARAAFPKNRNVLLSEDVLATTDGLNNKKKAKMLRKLHIPLFVIKASKDEMMQEKPGPNQPNQADELLQARYPDKNDQKGHSLLIKGGHGARFTNQVTSDLDSFLKESMPIIKTEPGTENW